MRRTVSSLTTISVLGLVALTTRDANAVIVGPDTFGYRAVDQANGAVYNYIDISAGLGALVINNADDTLAPPTVLGAPFTFYGEVLPSLRASSNGFLTSSGNSASFTNSCGPINAGGGGQHIAPLHDDLIASVYYAYLDQAAAANAGYPGETAGISVFQWEGRYFNDANSTVDFETIIFHDDNTILNLVAAATQGGSSSTSGIQSGNGNFTLLYSCNTAASITGGVTAVRYTPPPDVSINEVRVDQTSTDNDEYFEIAGPPGASLDGLFYVVLGDGAGASGTIEEVTSLAGQTIPASGYFVAAESTFTLGAEDFETVLDFENSDTTTHLLLRTFTGAVNNDLDPDNNGTLDTTPWFAVEDAIALIDNGDVDLPYAPGAACNAGPFCNSLDVAAVDVGHAFRCGDFDGTWNEGIFDVAANPNSDSPGAANNCACGDGILIIGETCDAGGESIMCDDDCTVPLCGDGNANMLAGEVCDDGGESAMCNADCTAAICGDGVTNMTTGETCDDEGESVMCDDDCSAPSCGDGNANEAAGEACDDGGESATCNDDCTVATCGDEIVNEAAGETCDDGGRSGTCNANCTTASCGDGIFNATAGEECDGDGNGTPGETATCDADCTAAMCGDMVVNDAAAEECDAGAEAADCDDDCTAPSCGDDNVNETAGEECDDGNTDDGDGCSATCIVEEEPGTSSGEESSSGGEESSTGGSEESGTTGDPTGDTGETSATDPDSSGTDPDTSGSASMSASDTNDEDSDTNDEDSDTDGDDESSSGGTGATAGDDGCGCNTTDERDVTASLLAFFGLGALRRRRRRA